MRNNHKVQKSTRASRSQFYVNIRYHQNNSWQGSIQRLDTGETINFRSALELMTLMETVIAQQSSDQHEGQRFRSWKSKKEVKDPNKKTNALSSQTS